MSTVASNGHVSLAERTKRDASGGPKCPACGARVSLVKDNRASGDDTRRRRVCCTCGCKFTTYETVYLREDGMDFLRQSGEVIW